MPVTVKQDGVVLTSAEVKSAAIEAVLIKADGTHVPYGKVSYSHRNPVINLVVNLWIKAHRKWVDLRYRKVLHP